MARSLLILEVSRKQDYIFAKKKLRENAERSGDIAYVTSSEFFEEAAEGLYSEQENLVYSGGGHTVLQFAGQEQAVQFAERVTGEVLRRWDGLELFAKTMPYDEGKTPGENLKDLSSALQKKKAFRQSSFRYLSFGVEQLDIDSFAPQLADEGEEAGADRGRGHEVIRAPKGWKYPSSLDSLIKGIDNFIAVVHIDGNSMGKRVDGVYRQYSQDWESCRAGLRRFSEGIQRDFEETFLELADVVCQRYPEHAPYLPLRPVILAGDDVTFVCPGKLGLECARVFLERLSQKVNEEDIEPYAACAGVALVHRKFPFHRAYDLAEELCSSAKRFGAQLDPEGRVCAMDWHIEFGEMKDSLGELREDYRTEDGGRLELRPVAVLTPEGCSSGIREYAFVRELCQRIQKELAQGGDAGRGKGSGGGGSRKQIPRSKVKDLRTALKQGEKETEFFLHDAEIAGLLYFGVDSELREGRMAKYQQMLRDRYQNQNQNSGSGQGQGQRETLGASAFRWIDGEKRCLFFDAIEMSDHFTALPDGERKVEK